MRFFKVLISDNAIADLESIVTYLSIVIREPKYAEKVYSSLKNAIAELDYMPNRYQLIEEEPYKSEGVRRKPIGKYLIYYLVIESLNTVVVAGITNSSKTRE